MTTPEYRILEHAKKYRSVNVSSIANDLCCSHELVCRTTRRLINNGYLYRYNDNSIFLTPKGEKELSKYEKITQRAQKPCDDLPKLPSWFTWKFVTEKFTFPLLIKLIGIAFMLTLTYKYFDRP